MKLITMVICILISLANIVSANDDFDTIRDLNKKETIRDLNTKERTLSYDDLELIPSFRDLKNSKK